MALMDTVMAAIGALLMLAAAIGLVAFSLLEDNRQKFKALDTEAKECAGGYWPDQETEVLKGECSVNKDAKGNVVLDGVYKYNLYSFIDEKTGSKNHCCRRLYDSCAKQSPNSQFAAADGTCPAGPPRMIPFMYEYEGRNVSCCKPFAYEYPNVSSTANLPKWSATRPIKAGEEALVTSTLGTATIKTEFVYVIADGQNGAPTKPLLVPQMDAEGKPTAVLIAADPKYQNAINAGAKHEQYWLSKGSSGDKYDGLIGGPYGAAAADPWLAFITKETCTPKYTWNESVEPNVCSSNLVYTNASITEATCPKLFNAGGAAQWQAATATTAAFCKPAVVTV